jgi:hypothetical protein
LWPATTTERFTTGDFIVRPPVNHYSKYAALYIMHSART